MSDSKRNKKKGRKRDGPNRKARLIVRNISFKTTEQDLREYFQKYGDIAELNLLKRTDGKSKGCAFVQFVAVQMAAKALYNSNGKEFQGRTIVTDWAVPKDKYVQQIEAPKEEIKIKQEAPSDDVTDVIAENIEIKTEIKEETDNENDSNSEKVAEGNDEITVKSNEESDFEEQPIDEENDSSDDETQQGNESEDEKEEIEIKKEEKSLQRPKVTSHDVSEGRTVFIKNVPFSATNEDLKQCMQQFGRTFYTLICKDRFTEHSKGTAFVKFIDKEDAEKCLQAGTELTLLGNILDCYPALDKKEINLKAAQSKEKVRDSRNLYLIKEGVILAGSAAANGVSKTDMEKRLHLEQWKTQMLRNLHMFISRNRLVIHNVPSTWTDKKLRALFLKHGGAKATITEAKIMRDLRNMDSSGIGKSKEYGFVTFTNHDNALTALRSLNNNPNIFSAARRPIVAFSIENRIMVNAKQKRIEKSRQRNPLCKDYSPIVTTDASGENSKSTETNVNKNRKRKYPRDKSFSKDSSQAEENNYSGLIGQPGITKLRSKSKLQTQAKIHHERLKKERKLKKAKLNFNKERVKQPKQKMKKKNEDSDHFSKLVNKYKSTLVANNIKKRKWYE